MSSSLVPSKTSAFRTLRQPRTGGAEPLPEPVQTSGSVTVMPDSIPPITQQVVDAEELRLAELRVQLDHEAAVRAAKEEAERRSKEGTGSPVAKTAIVHNASSASLQGVERRLSRQNAAAQPPILAPHAMNPSSLIPNLGSSLPVGGGGVVATPSAPNHRDGAQTMRSESPPAPTMQTPRTTAIHSEQPPRNPAAVVPTSDPYSTRDGPVESKPTAYPSVASKTGGSAVVTYPSPEIMKQQEAFMRAQQLAMTTRRQPMVVGPGAGGWPHGGRKFDNRRDRDREWDRGRDRSESTDDQTSTTTGTGTTYTATATSATTTTTTTTMESSSDSNSGDSPFDRNLSPPNAYYAPSLSIRRGPGMTHSDGLSNMHPQGRAMNTPLTARVHPTQQPVTARGMPLTARGMPTHQPLTARGGGNTYPHFFNHHHQQQQQQLLLLNTRGGAPQRPLETARSVPIPHHIQPQQPLTARGYSTPQAQPLPLTARGAPMPGPIIMQSIPLTARGVARSVSAASPPPPATRHAPIIHRGRSPVRSHWADDTESSSGSESTTRGPPRRVGVKSASRRKVLRSSSAPPPRRRRDFEPNPSVRRRALSPQPNSQPFSQHHHNHYHHSYQGRHHHHHSHHHHPHNVYLQGGYQHFQHPQQHYRLGL